MPKAAIQTETVLTNVNIRPSRKRWGFVLLILAALLLSALPAAARDYRISRFDDRITVLDNGAMIVDEEIRFVFEGSFQGVHRRIPIEYPGPNFSNYTLFVKVLSVTNENGTPLKYDNKLKGNYRELTIYIPGAIDTEQVVKIEYRVANGVRFFPGYDELYWNVTGNDWRVPIDSTSAFVALPSSAAGQVRAKAYTGAYGSQEADAESRIEGSNIRFETNNPLPARSGMTVDVYIPKGILREPGWFTRTLWWVESNPAVVVPVFAFLVMFTVWWTVGRDPDPGMSVAAMYEPPKGISPAEAGTLIDDQVSPRDVTSTLIDLAVRGYLKIEETNEKVLLFNRRDYIFHLLKPQTEWEGLAAHEREMLDNMFGPGERSISLSSLKNRFYMALPSVKQEIMSALKDKGMYRVDPDSAGGYGLVSVLIIALPFLYLQLTGKMNLFQAPVIAIVSIAITAVIVFLFARILSAKSLRGARTAVHVLGLKEFMTRVDADRLKRMPPDTFEKFLAYAMALGVEKHWAKAFEGIIQNPPTWYVGPTPMGMWNPILFAHSMNTMTSSAYEAFTAAPQASAAGSGFGGSGGSGGGFSGGGFGGGGGDAF